MGCIGRSSRRSRYFAFLLAAPRTSQKGQINFFGALKQFSSASLLPSTSPAQTKGKKKGKGAAAAAAAARNLRRASPLTSTSAAQPFVQQN